jgi:hypothetical protein
VFNHVSINNSGSYSINYTAPAGFDGFTKLYFIFGTNTGGTDPHYFYMDNFVVAKAGAIPDPNGPPANIQCSDQCLALNRYFPDLLMHKDYYAGGSPMPGRNYTSSSYRYGFNGQEKDDEVSGSGNSYTAEFWQYDSRLGRRWNVDPMFSAKPWMSPYHAFSNKPILNIDPNGANDDEFNVDTKSGEITKISNKGGDKIDYYNVGTKDKSGVFSTNQVVEIPRPEGGGNINSFRVQEDAKGTISTFNIPGTETSGFILEPAGPSTTTANQDLRIPEGSYNLEAYSSKNYPNTFRIFNSEVSKDRKILFHAGNFHDNTTGCSLPGGSFGIGKLGDAKVTPERAGFLRTSGSGPKLKQINSFIIQKGPENVKYNIFNIIPPKK